MVQPYGTRLLRLLTLLGERPGPLSLAEISAALDLPPSSAHRLLGPLLDGGFVERAPNRRYRVGSEFVRVANLVESHHDVVAAARPFVTATAEGCGETCLLGLLTADRTHLLLAFKAESRHKLRFSFDMQQNIPLVWGSLGRATASGLEPVLLDRVMAEAEPSPLTGAPPPTRAEFEAELASIRQMGLAVSRGHRAAPDAVGISAPIRDARGQVRGALGVVSPGARLDVEKREEIARLVRLNAAGVSRSLGWTEHATRTG